MLLVVFCLTSMPRLWALTLISTTAPSASLAVVERADRSLAVRAATMPAWMAAPRATTSLTASELSGALPLSSRSICPGHRHVRRAADQQDAIDLVPADARPGAAPAASSSRVRVSRSRVSVSNSLRVSVDCQHLAGVRAGDAGLRAACSGCAWPARRRSCSPASDCGSVRGSVPCCLMNWPAT